jgi:hypothetical protein
MQAASSKQQAPNVTRHTFFASEPVIHAIRWYYEKHRHEKSAHGLFKEVEDALHKARQGVVQGSSVHSPHGRHQQQTPSSRHQNHHGCRTPKQKVKVRGQQAHEKCVEQVGEPAPDVHDDQCSRMLNCQDRVPSATASKHRQSSHAVAFRLRHRADKTRRRGSYVSDTWVMTKAMHVSTTAMCVLCQNPSWFSNFLYICCTSSSVHFLRRHGEQCASYVSLSRPRSWPHSPSACPGRWGLCCITARINLCHRATFWMP